MKINMVEVSRHYLDLPQIKCHQVGKMAKWINLHQELLEIIFDLCLLPYQIRMRSVCKTWRLILKTPRELPWLMMLPKKNQEEDHRHQDPDARAFFSLSEQKEDHHPDACAFFSLSKQKIHTIHLPEIQGKRCRGSFQNGWLMIIDELDIFLFHPWSKKRLELLHRSTLDFKYHSCIKHLGIPYMKMMRPHRIRKAALSDDCKLMVVVVYESDMVQLAFYRIGDDAWTDIVVPPGPMDVIYHNGQFYCITMWGGVYLVHIENGNSYAKRLTENMKEPFGGLYLVPDMLTDTNIMFVILRERVTRANVHETRDTIHFHIYKFPLGEKGPLDQEKEVVNKLIKVESLGDRVIFLGYNSPITVMASEFPGLKGNCIYFTDDSGASYANGPGDCGVFNVEDGTVEQLFAHGYHPAFAPPIWFATPPYSSYQRD
ncbi:F-box protein SKIP23-like protein [Cinnamomum micranthum f. kanehirae]|uniref:F-box protein SKIP23-like protein n=1 Tax=Cinnamomum micranthum f. kanehirae TaxID=337451 RepID=A0A3S3M252_9MAGN|nr:F-box protein SKIP23-like protein [Cinnamomum micranthum f. kanehirae]